MTVTGTLVTEGIGYAVTVALPEKNKAQITINSPRTLAGYSFSVDDGKVCVFYESMAIELVPPAAQLPMAWVSDMLSLAPEDYLYSTEEDGMTVSYYSSDKGETVIYSRDSNTPCRIKHTLNNKTLVLEIDTLLIQ